VRPAPLLEVEDVHASYGRTRVLHGVTFTVHAGEVTALLGANGAGKTTTLRALTGLVHVTGTIRFAGTSLCGMPTEEIVRLGIAHVPEGRGTLRALTVEENLLVGAYTRRDSRIAADLELMYAHFPKLEVRRTQVAATLSGGEQQMLAIARALMLRPRLLLLDEPSHGLAPIVVQEIFQIVTAINRDEGVSVLLVEQNAALALSIAHHAFLLETGRMVTSGASTELAANDSIRHAYLGH
jgi:branched-chain amino acid transport system ATP-binding protein